MRDATDALQVALNRDITAVLTANRATATFCDEIPDNAAPPYIKLARMVQVPDPDNNVCYEGAIVTVTLHIWTQSVGTVEAKALGALIMPVIDAPLDIEGWRVIVHEALSADYGHDGETNVLGVITQRYELQFVS